MVIQSPRRTRSLAIPAPPILSSSLAKRSSAPAWYRGDHCIVSYGDTIAEDLCFDNLTQLEYCNDEHEDQVEDSFICEDCASVGAKELEVGCHDAKEDEVEYYDAKEDEVESDNVEMVGFNIAEESTAWYRGDQCIDSHGDSIAEDVCFDDPTQLEQSDDEFLWDGNYDFTSHMEETVGDADCICEGCLSDDAKEPEEEWSGSYDAEEETFCYDHQEDIDAEDCSYY